MPPRSLRRLPVSLAVLSATLTPLHSNLALAQCTATAHAPTATCSGDLSGGVVLFNVGTVTVDSLTAPIAPSLQTDGVLLANSPVVGGGTSISPGTILFTGGNYGVTTTGAAGVRVLIQGVDGWGGSGYTTDSNGTAVGESGQSGQTGLAATLVLTAPSLTSSAYDDPGQAPFLGYGVRVVSDGGNGGEGWAQPLDPNGGSTTTQKGGDSGDGGQGGTASANVQVPNLSLTGIGTGILVSSVGGSPGFTMPTDLVGMGSLIGGSGGDGGAGGAASADIAVANFNVTNGNGAGVLVQSLGASGGYGTSASNDGISTISQYASQGGDGGAGGNGGTAQLTGSLVLTAAATGPFDGVRVESIAGAGGGGGDASNSTGGTYGGKGGVGGMGGAASLGSPSGYFGARIGVSGDNARGVFVRSVGGAGGSGGTANSIDVAANGAQLGPGPGGDASVYLQGGVTTAGGESDAIIAQSVGGYFGQDGFGASTLSSGYGGQATAQLSLTSSSTYAVTTSGDTSDTVFVQSVGGGGGSAFTPLGTQVLGGTGDAGGNGGQAWTWISGNAGIFTSGRFARGIYVESLGGGGGNAGPSTGVNTIGASGGTGGDGGLAHADVSVPVVTTGDQSDGIVVASRGGGGGSAASATTFGVIGGNNGGRAGNGGTAELILSGAVSTQGDDADAVFIQSVGGGGGDGASVSSTGVIYDSAVGGSGGTGGNGGTVTLNGIDDLVEPGPIQTSGDRSRGILAQSIGGGGGNGGDATTLTVAGIDISHTVGGSAAGGGAGGAVSINSLAPITTKGHLSDGILAQSVGGGGGVGGMAIGSSTLGGFTLTHAVGGQGGAGGNGGQVGVDSSADITTSGSHAHGLLAQSIGGGGGHGGSAIGAISGTPFGVSITVGGGGSSGGSAGMVIVDTLGSIQTSGDGAKGILAQSIGGGGGDAGSLASSAGYADLAKIDLTTGGAGGPGGSGGMVSVIAGPVTTTGNNATAIYALSQGGGGGASSMAVSAQAGAIGTVNVTTGGAGGDGGVSSAVGLWTTDDVTTSGALSSAILAQSIGGGGGQALSSVSASVIDVGNVQITHGGAGGNGGQAGTVSVSTDDESTISTDGAFSSAIVAQSLGGQGGQGGFAAEFSANISAGTDGVTGQVGVTLGGAGGAGGKANNVTINNNSTINVSDIASFGILAQSIGGSGGDGGSIVAGNLDMSTKASINVDVELGGSGGNGSTAGTVTVDNYGAITTNAYDAIGLFGQSVGGSGGNGGSIHTLAVQIGPAAPESVTVSLGGAGGVGAVGNDVTLTNSGPITTYKGGSDGIYGQSIGGNGGRGGSTGYIGLNLTPPVNYSDSGFPLEISVNVGKGGGGGTGADAGNVEVKNYAAISTKGDHARGIFAQSVGGGGGDGGTASATSFALSDICNVGSGEYVCPESEPGFSISSTVQIGGNGALAGNGGAVTVDNSGTISTAGNMSHGIYAQSVGGGGGTGGDGSLGIEAWTSNTILNNLADIPSNFLPSFNSTDVAIGGTAGAAGDGGAVTVHNTGNITAAGPDPSIVQRYTGIADLPADAFLPLLAGGAGIYAQSVGGGGGNGGAGSSGLSATLTLGRAGSGGGNGGAVWVTNGGIITTGGLSGTGIFAQSVGGGGGSAGDVGLGFSDSWTQLNIGTGLGIQEDAGNGGDGGAVNVTSSGAITTTGQAADGIIAQSIGGSGGIAALSYSSALSTTVFAGSGGANGSGGDVYVEVDAPISVSGTGSVGVVAQSAGGAVVGNSSGTVKVEANADISATGSGGRGILVASSSYQNQATGAVTIGIAADATVSTGAQGAETVGVFGAGAGSSLQNHGTITSGNAASYAVRVSSPFTFSVQNDGTITGSMSGTDSSAITGIDSDQLQTDGGVNGAMFGVPSSIDLLNKPGGVVNAGPLLDVSHLTNQGTLAVGGQGQIGNTRLTGNLTQVDGGVLAVDLNPGGSGSAGLSDRLSIDGRADLGGRVVVNVVDPWQPMAGVQSVLILTADEGLTYDELEHAQSAVAQYRFIEPSPGALHLAYDIDFANPGILAATNDNQDGIARHLHGVYRSQALDPGMARDLIAIEDQGSYARVMNTLGAELAVNNQTVSLLSTIAFNDALLSCAERAGDYRFFDQGQCGWLRLRGQRFTQRETHDNLGFDENSWQLAGGGQIDVGNDWHLGAALSYAGRSLNADDSNASSDGGQFQAGISAKRRWGATELSSSLAIGYGDFDNDRVPWPGAVVNGTQKLWLFSGQVRIAHLLQWGRWAFKPRLDLGVDYLTMEAFNESGTTDLRLHIDGQSDTYFNLQPAIDIATEIETANGILIRPKLTLGITQFLGDTSPTVSGRFVSAPGNVPSFTASTGLDQTRFDVAAAVDIFTRSDLMIRAEVFGSFSDNSESYGGGLKIGMEF